MWKIKIMRKNKRTCLLMGNGIQTTLRYLRTTEKQISKEVFNQIMKTTIKREKTKKIRFQVSKVIRK